MLNLGILLLIIEYSNFSRVPESSIELLNSTRSPISRVELEFDSSSLSRARVRFEITQVEL